VAIRCIGRRARRHPKALKSRRSGRLRAMDDATPDAFRVIGSPVKRNGDAALLRGQGRYVDDIHFPGMLHASFVRSPHPHAEIRAIDAGRAKSQPGVTAVFTANDLAPHLTMMRMPVGQPSAAIRQSLDPYVLAVDEVSYVGEPVAVVIAEHAYLAEDAAALVDIDYDPLPAAGDARAAGESGAATTHKDAPDNLVAQFTLDYGDCATALAGAPHVFRDRFFQHKGLGNAMECRGVAARFDSLDDMLMVWSGTQMAHRSRDILAKLLGRNEERLRVVAPNVGGGFGPKFIFYSEEVVIPLAAMLLGRPVKWIEDRREHFTATTQERDQYWDVEAACDADGKLIALRGALLHDHGAYTPYGINLPYNAGTNLLGPYILPHYELNISSIATNKTPVTPVRGAGRPQGTFVMERMLDRMAAELGLDRAEIRRRNLIQPAAMPYVTRVASRDGSAMTYDSGDYPASMALALERGKYDDFEARREAARREGRFLGIGIANYVEGTGRGPFESATVRISPSGQVSVYTGATDQGQGISTVLAQICAEALGLDTDDVTVIAGDTRMVPLGLGAFASRQTVTAGSSVHVAANEVRDKALAVAAHILEAAEEDLEITNGDVRVKGVADMSVSLGEIAGALAGVPGYNLPGGIAPGLDANANFSPDMPTYCNGTHVVEIEVDPETGAVEILNYVAVHDSGRLINPMIVDGQVMGGAVHGIGNALFEHMVFDDGGQPQTVTLAEYIMPSAPEAPTIDIIHMESPTPLNPLGVKGAGEGGTIPATSAIASAVDDALRDFNFRVTDLPITPSYIVEQIAKSRSA
jgi:aerobic carbon-monoxide dehydrogenase large subunit